MRAGALKDQIIIQTAIESVDEYGQPTKVWSDLSTVRAEARHMGTGPETEQGGKIEGRHLVEFRIRYTDVNLTDRISFDSEIYEIIDIRNLYNADREIKIRAARDG